MNVQKILLSIAVPALLAACHSRPGSLNQRELMKYIKTPSNGLLKDVEDRGIKTSIRFEPSCLMAKREMIAGGFVGDSVWQQLTGRFDKNYYFVLKFSKNDKEVIRQMGSFASYSDMMQVMSFEMGRYVNMTTDLRDTISLSDFVFEQDYGYTDGNAILLSFPREKLDKAGVMDIHVGEFGLGVGSLLFSFKKEDLDRIPALDYTKM